MIPDWTRARCADTPTGIMFPSSGEGHDPHAELVAAKAVCRGCPIIDPCLEHALAHNIAYGVWGGQGERDRRRIRRQRGPTTTRVPGTRATR